MIRNEYRRDVLESLITRMGYVETVKSEMSTMYVHPFAKNEIILDTSYPVIVAKLMERKVRDDLKINEDYFELLFDSEIQIFSENNSSHE